jgi:hemerythrin
MVTFAVFTKEMETGVSKIDGQHGELIEKINHLLSLCREQSFSKKEIEDTITFLSDYVVKHFSEEEELQKECDYPKHEEHKTMHQDFVKEFTSMKIMYLNEQDTVQFPLDLTKFIKNWLLKHIKEVDVEFGKFYKEQIETT